MRLKYVTYQEPNSNSLRIRYSDIPAKWLYGWRGLSAVNGHSDTFIKCYRPYFNLAVF